MGKYLGERRIKDFIGKEEKKNPQPMAVFSFMFKDNFYLASRSSPRQL